MAIVFMVTLICFSQDGYKTTDEIGEMMGRQVYYHFSNHLLNHFRPGFAHSFGLWILHHSIDVLVWICLRSSFHRVYTYDVGICVLR